MLYKTETSQFICAANQLVDFFMSGVLVVNSLMSIYKKNKPSNSTKKQK